MLGLVRICLGALCLAAALLQAGGDARATDISLEGDLIQGGLVVGRLAPGSRVSLDGRALRIAPDGRFLIGFGRDAGPKAWLVWAGPGAAEETRELAVASRTYAIQRIDGLPSAKVTPRPEDIARIEADNTAIGKVRARPSPRLLFQGGFAWPVRGPISGVFGSQRVLNGTPKNPHNGTDIVAPEGTLITAPAAGIVALAQDDMFYTGKTMMIDHGLGLTSVYAHMSAILVKQGDRVEKGEAIGRVGRSGRASGAHLHWGATLEETHIDPALLAGPMDGG